MLKKLQQDHVECLSHKVSKAEIYDKLDELSKTIEIEANRIGLDSATNTPDYRIADICHNALFDYFDGKIL